MSDLKKFYPEGWIRYCPECMDYVSQSDPQNFSGRKSVIIDDEPCKKCQDTHEQEVREAQALLGRLGVAKEAVKA